MKSQVNKLFSGRKNQILNPAIDYSALPKATSHNWHAGSSQLEVREAWRKVTSENKDSITIELWNQEFELKANWSLSGKSCSYTGGVTKEFFENNTGLKASKHSDPYISIHNATDIEINNGKKSFAGICPTLITIK